MERDTAGPCTRDAARRSPVGAAPSASVSEPSADTQRARATDAARSTIASLHHGKRAVLAGALQLVVSLGCAAPPSANGPDAEDAHVDAAPRSHVLTARIGRRRLEDEDVYRPVHEPYVFGFEYAQRLGRSPFAFEAGIVTAGDVDEEYHFLSSDESSESLFLEGDVGLRTTLDLGPVQLFAGGGLSLTYAEFEMEVAGPGDFSEEDTATGIYAHAGLLWNLWRGTFIGIEARILRGTDVVLGGLVDTDVDYGEAALLLGWAPLGRRE